MAVQKKKLKACIYGHKFYKSSDCPVCPVSESKKNPIEDIPKISAPARRALKSAGIKSLSDVSKLTEENLLALHGFGPSTIPILKNALKAKGLSFK